MSSVLSRIQIIMEANAANYNNELRRARDHSSSTFGKISAAAGKMALGVGAALAGMGALSVKTAMSFETAMAEVNKTVDFTTNYALADLKTELEDLTKTMPLTFEELAKIAAAGGQSGVAAEGLKEFTETIAKMSIAFDISADETADAMAKIASSYNVPIENVKDLGDAINEVSNSGAVKANEIVDFMLRVGQSASNLGIAGEAAAALGGALIDAGGSVEVVGTAMKSVFTDMSNTKWIADNSKALTGLGIDMEEYAKVVKTDGLAAFMMIRDGVMSAENPIETLNDLFDAAGGNVASLFSEGSKVEAMLGSVGQVAGVAATHIGSLDKEYQAMADTSANAFILMQNSTRLVLAAAGEAFLPAVRQMTDALVPLIQNVAAWAKENPELIVTIAKVTAVVLGAIIAVSAISSVVTAATTAWIGLSTVFGIVKVAVLAVGGALSVPILVIGALIAAGVALYLNWDTVSAYAKALGEDIKYGFNMAVDAANNFADGIVNGVVDGFNGAVSAANQFADDVVNSLVGGFNTAVAAVSSALSSMRSYFTSSFPAMTAIATAAIQTIGAVFTTGFNLVKNTVQTVMNVIKALIRGDMQGVVSAFKNGFSTAVSVVGAGVNNVVTVFKGLGSKMLQIGKDVIQGFIDGMKAKWSALKSTVANIGSSVISVFRSKKDGFDTHSPSKATHGIGADVTQGLANGIKSKGNTVVKAAKNVAQDAINAIKGGLASLEKEIALFGNSSKLDEFNFDVKVGKYAGASAGDISETRELIRQVSALQTKSDITKDIASFNRAVLELQRPYNTELQQINFVLDDINGKYKDATEHQKNSLRNAAAELDLFKTGATYRNVILGIEREMSLIDNNSMFSQWAYDLLDANNALSELDDTLKEGILESVVKLQNAIATSRVNGVIKDLQKELALLDDNSALAELNYDLANTEKYANASEESIAALRVALTELQTAQSQIKTQSALSAMLTGISNENPLDKLRNDYNDRLQIIKDFELAHNMIVGAAVSERLAVEESYQNAKRNLMLTQGEALFGDLAGMAKSFAGEQSGIYRGLFAIEKGFAIAQSAIAIQQSIAKAMAVGFPANIPIIGQAISQGASILSNIKSVAMPVGQAHDGIVNVPREGTWVLDKNERVVKADDNRKLSDFLDNNSKTGADGGNTNVIIHNYTGEKVTERRNDKGELELIIGQQIAKQLPQHVNDEYSPFNKAMKNNYHLQRKLG